MTLGNKLSKLRKENNYTQDQLADILGVSRQSVSKWESDLAYPEVEKLIRIGELYNCSMDYLLKEKKVNYQSNSNSTKLNFRISSFEKKSKKTICGLPLWHICFGHGRSAKGIFALGFIAKGVFSLGLISIGIFSLGLLSLGLIATGLLSIGLLSIGTLSGGIIALGSVSIGIISIGALSIGYFSFGGMAIGKYFAMGNYARAMIALGKTEAIGILYQNFIELNVNEILNVEGLLDRNVPSFLQWASEIVKRFV